MSEAALKYSVRKMEENHADGKKNIPLRRIVNGIIRLHGGEDSSVICNEVKKLSNQIDNLKAEVKRLKNENDSLMNNALYDTKMLESYSDLCRDLRSAIDSKCLPKKSN